LYDAELAFKSRQEFKDADNRFDEPKNTFGTYGNFQLVGQGEKTNEKCGRFFGFKGCDNVDLHNKTDLYGVNYAGKVYMFKVFNSCDKPSCPVCYKKGWAVREAGRIEARLKIASKRLGLIEHIIASVPSRDYGLGIKALRSKVDAILKKRGVHGVKIFHAFRYNPRRHWYWSPHFHVLGFVLGGYKCRGCVKDCAGCDGFEVRTRECFKTDGYLVKVLPVRKTVGGTAWYQLNHASIKKNVKNFHVATWFGLCGYRKLKVTPELMNQFVRKRVCPICQYELRNFRYSGRDASILACYRSTIDKCEEREFFDDLEDNIGLRQWDEVFRRGFED